MRVCIPIDFLPQGGGFYFLKLFKLHIANIGWQLTNDVTDHYDVLFTNHWMTPLDEIFRGIRHNPRVRIVQRIDGAAQDYGRDAEADLRQAKVNRLADLTIFQSEYARYATRIKFPIISEDGPVINNPVDISVFTPNGPKMDLPQADRMAVVSWSTNPKKGAANVYEVARNNPKIDFLLCGNYKEVPNLSNLHQLGLLDREDLATALRTCQAMLTFSQNEACPNHVLEALSTGLPVLYSDSGAMAEVIGECGYPVTVENFKERFSKLVENLSFLAAQSRQRALDCFRPEVVFPKYTQAIADAVKGRLRKSLFSRKILAWKNMLF
jgi:glycosyltransferase involved in cell wall biosynthesis